MAGIAVGTKRRKKVMPAAKQSRQQRRADFAWRTIFSLNRLGAEATALTAIAALLYGLSNIVIPYVWVHTVGDAVPLEGKAEHEASIKAEEDKRAADILEHQKADAEIVNQLKQLDMRQQASIARGEILNKSVNSARIIALRGEILTLQGKDDFASRTLLAKDQTELDDLISAAALMP